MVATHVPNFARSKKAAAVKQIREKLVAVIIKVLPNPRRIAKAAPTTGQLKRESNMI
jgi:hypothetical protein